MIWIFESCKTYFFLSGPEGNCSGWLKVAAMPLRLNNKNNKALFIYRSISLRYRWEEKCNA